MSDLSFTSSASNAEDSVVGKLVGQAPVCPDVSALAAAGVGGPECAKIMSEYYKAYAVYASGGVQASVSDKPAGKASRRRGCRGSGRSQVSSASGYQGPRRRLLLGDRAYDCTMAELLVQPYHRLDPSALGRVKFTRVADGRFHTSNLGVEPLQVFAACASGRVWPGGSIGEYCASMQVLPAIVGKMDDKSVLLGVEQIFRAAPLQSPVGATDGVFLHCDTNARREFLVQDAPKLDAQLGIKVVSQHKQATVVSAAAFDPKIASKVLGRLGSVSYSNLGFVVHDSDFGKPASLTDLSSVTGLCYLNLVRCAHQAQALTNLGWRPTLEQLLFSPQQWFLDYGTVALRVIELDSASVHVFRTDDGASDDEAWSWFARASLLSRNFMSGTWGHVLQQRAGTVEMPIGIGLDCRVGQADPIDIVKGVVSRYSMLDAKETEFDMGIRLAMKSQGLVGADEKRQLRMYAAVGDAAITLRVAVYCAEVRVTPQQYQQLRSQVTSNANLAALLDNTSLIGCLMADANGLSVKSKAESLEAVVGVVSTCYGSQAVKTLLDSYFSMSLNKLVGAVDSELAKSKLSI